jgi:hypothetical protein
MVAAIGVSCALSACGSGTATLQPTTTPSTLTLNPAEALAKGKQYGANALARSNPAYYCPRIATDFVDPTANPGSWNAFVEGCLSG